MKTWTPISASFATASAIGFIIIGFILVSGSSQKRIEFSLRLPEEMR